MDQSPADDKITNKISNKFLNPTWIKSSAQSYHQLKSQVENPGL